MRTRSEIRTAVSNTLAVATLTIETAGPGFTELTREAKAFLDEVGAGDGALLVFLRHTSASIVIQENADPDVQSDLLTALRRLAPDHAGWVHDAEGPDDMPAHIKTMLTTVSVQIPVINGTLALGTWQGLYLIEHRAQPHKRKIVLQFCGSCAN
jgi:secondary thiamine-phosphate synthase enzyme